MKERFLLDFVAVATTVLSKDIFVTSFSKLQQVGNVRTCPFPSIQGYCNQNFQVVRSGLWGNWDCRSSDNFALFQSVFFEDEEISEVSVGDFRWSGASKPSPDIPPEDIPLLVMHALEFNNVPTKDAGLITVWEFAGDTLRHIFQHNMTEFIDSAHETADTMITSFYGAAMKGQGWAMETELNRVGGEDGWIATQVMRTVCSDGRVRRWQFELRKNRRPPNMNAWYVESIGSSDRNGHFEGRIMWDKNRKE